MERHLQRLSGLLEEAIAGMTPVELEWHPEGKWCAAEILEHLFLAYSSTVKGLRRQMEKAAANCPPMTFRDHVGQFVVITLGHMPEGRKSPEQVKPRGMPAGEVPNAIRDALPALDAAITECEKRFGARVRIMNHLILGPLTAAGWRKFHFVHSRHHVMQIRRLREQMQSGRATRA